MAIKYLAGERIIGTAAERTAMTVSNSVTFNDDFSSYANQSAADSAWVPSALNEIRVNISNDNIDWETAGDGDTRVFTHDLGAGNVSDTKWFLRFRVRFSSIVTGQGAGNWWFGVSDSAVGNTVSQDHIGMQGRMNVQNYYAQDTDNSAIPDSGGDNYVARAWATATNYFFEIIRLSATTYAIRRYSDSTYGTMSDSATGTCASTCDGLRYIKMSNYGHSWTGNGSTVGIIDDIKFYNGVTSPSAYPNLPNGVVLEESDTGTHYMWDGTDTWNEIT